MTDAWPSHEETGGNKDRDHSGTTVDCSLSHARETTLSTHVGDRASLPRKCMIAHGGEANGIRGFAAVDSALQ